MSIDKLTKELNDFEKMTKAVVTIGEAVKEGLLKKQHLSQLEELSGKKSGEIDSLNEEIGRINKKISNKRASASDIISKAEKSADDIIIQAMAEAKVIVEKAKAQEKKSRDVVRELADEAKSLEAKNASVDLENSKVEKKVNSAKEYLRSLAG
jgi:F0F1-type ATP synthase membrane subunit b/b'